MRIKGDRRQFFQWDLDQQLIVEEDCTEVQFSNGTTSMALCCAVKEVDGSRVADVPNELLQTAADLHAYAWDGAKKCVVSHRVFGVEAKAKPAEYAYTQTEVLRYRDLAELATAAAEAAAKSASEAQKVVAAYEAGELNGKNGYTPVRGVDYWTEEDQLEAKLSFKLIETITLEEETTRVICPFDKMYKAVRVRITFSSQTTSVGYMYSKIVPNGVVANWDAYGNMCGTDLPGGTMYADHIRMASEFSPLAMFSTATANGNEYTQPLKMCFPIPSQYVYNEKDGFAGIMIDTYAMSFPAGTVIHNLTSHNMNHSSSRNYD